MFKNYIQVALRNLAKRKSFAIINILGLAIGIACCLLIAVYTLHELSYDDFHAKADRLYRITQTTETSAKVEKGASTPFLVGPTLENDFPASIAQTVRFYDMQEDYRTMINKERDRAFRIDHFFFTDSTFFNVFSVELLRGEADQVLSKPMSLVITEEYARRYFDDENPIGQTLNFKGVADFTVTGVMESLPAASHMEIEMLASFNSLAKIYGTTAFMERWFWNPVWTYVLLEEGASPQALETQFPRFVEKNYTNRAEGEKVSIGLQPVTDIHLYSNLDNEMNANSSIFYIYLLLIIGALILVIACINFMNLSTARSTERAREVGMRKVLGAHRGQLFAQFMGESFLMSFLGIALAILLAFLALPWFNNFLDKQLSFAFLETGTILFGLVGLFVVIGLLSGVYPALYLSGFSPTRVMGDKSSTGNSGQFFRKSLVVFQFTLSVMLMIGTILVYLQLQHMQQQKLGFDKERVVVMPIKQTLIAWEFEKFRDLASASPHIVAVTGTNKILGSEKQFFGKYSPANRPAAPPTNMVLEVLHGFLDTYKIDLLAGRGFSRDHPTDADQAILVNRAMLQQLDAETPREALGKKIQYTMHDDTIQEYEVIGVVANFNYTSIKKEIDPVVIKLVEGIRPTVRNIKYAAVKFAPNSIQAGLKDLKSAWEEVNYIDPFSYSFQDDELQKIYASETRMSNIIGVFALLCILVACLGLFGLASFTSSLRTKEIGIRKTLGATVSDILVLLSKNYIKLVLLANIIAWPLIYYLMAQWLQNFPTHINLGWNVVLVFVLVALTSLVICLVTVSYQSMRAALINPVNSIRQE